MGQSPRTSAVGRAQGRLRSGNKAGSGGPGYGSTYIYGVGMVHGKLGQAGDGSGRDFFFIQKSINGNGQGVDF